MYKECTVHELARGTTLQNSFNKRNSFMQKRLTAVFVHISRKIYKNNLQCVQNVLRTNTIFIQERVQLMLLPLIWVFKRES